MLRLPDAWTWDFWLADTGQEFHLFFLRASRALGAPDRRHYRASVGHAVSADLYNWSLLPDALVPGDRPAFDDIATWTGSVISGPDGLWYMYYTGISADEGGLVQRIGLSTSEDLIRWNRHPDFNVLGADSRWYEKLGESSWTSEAWRDPWVFWNPTDKMWHMFVTSRSNKGDEDSRGVVGHLLSNDLIHWEVTAPVSQPNCGFGVMEVMQVEEVEGRSVLLFSCPHPELSASKREKETRGGIWVAVGDDLLGGFDVANAHLLSDDRLYSGRLVRNRSGKWMLLAFHNQDANGEFVGEVSDPIPVTWDDDGHLVLVDSGPSLQLVEDIARTEITEVRSYVPPKVARA
ncbi:MAG: glycosyl hydrolase family 32 [Actinomycetota bacterium]|nr:MAG: glycosyl hydrolase family 32 [Actinomycetota bacterium]